MVSIHFLDLASVLAARLAPVVDMMTGVVGDVSRQVSRKLD